MKNSLTHTARTRVNKQGSLKVELVVDSSQAIPLLYVRRRFEVFVNVLYVQFKDNVIATG